MRSPVSVRRFLDELCSELGGMCPEAIGVSSSEGSPEHSDNDSPMSCDDDSPNTSDEDKCESSPPPMNDDGWPSFEELMEEVDRGLAAMSTPPQQPTITPEQKARMVANIRTPLTKPTIWMLTLMAINEVGRHWRAMSHRPSLSKMARQRIFVILEELVDVRMSLLRGVEEDPRRWMACLETDFGSEMQRSIADTWARLGAAAPMMDDNRTWLVARTFNAAVSYSELLERQFDMMGGH
ncbi:hypothetical protein ACRE_030750 [Hapsidospora chrysogenum ATCC 11550]|uniref:Uncharacterized protein n=1 Tax=Hapsidospora chrysogenum (strain ATCC 11550 / CBS 779.69 / DSM 880 / IAM 14645 / JCM 23072 / IMI 49137) TaxID=857340 RepID=A0A086T9U3_HAPC1|nr:hypothetical protein ACRE_030750 [Hapsidospora chrysogenum ATCC 11550]